MLSLRACLTSYSMATVTVVLAGCAAAPDAPAAGAAAPAAPAPRCDKREVTGSRMARCEEGTRTRDVNVISGESIRATGMPSTGGSGTPAN
jgi:hypothetical protein